jgi:formiminotetrahydrofolate cyclodeaminase
MTKPERWIDASLAEFTRAAAAQGPVPGSGSVAAALGALGAGMASMALGSARGEASAARLAAEAGELAEGLLACVDEDSHAYAGYLEARAGRGDLAAAVEGSIAVPEAIAERALAALVCLERGFPAVRPRLHSEGVTATQALLAAAESATFTARSNLPGLGDVRAREARAAALETRVARARDLARTLLDRLQPR